MNLRSLVPVLVVFIPLGLAGKECDVAPAPPSSDAAIDGSTESQKWLELNEFSVAQLEADYANAISTRANEDQGNEFFLSVVADVARTEFMMPIVFQAAPDVNEAPLPAPAPVPAPAPAEPKLETVLPPVVETPEEMRIKELEMENAALKERLSRAEPFVDPDWPAQETRQRRKIRVRPRQARAADIERRVRPPVVHTSRYAIRFKPFTRAAMDTQMWGYLPRAQAQSLADQNRFFGNATKALGEGITSREYRGVRLEVQKAMLRRELSARYAVQYLADIVDVFNDYERLKRFHLTGGVSRPVDGESFRRDPDLMFKWASEVNERQRELSRESS